MVAQMVANIEIDIDVVIKAAASYFECSVSELTMENIFEYVNDGMSYLENNKAKGIKAVSDGWSTTCFGDTLYKKLSDKLSEMSIAEN